MGDGSSAALWFGASGVEVLDVVVDGGELVVSVQTTATVVGCTGCGTRARAKDRRWVTVRDAPTAGRPVRVRWWKRIWACPDGDCDVRTWTERAELAGRRRVLTDRAAEWAVDRLEALEGTTASLARDFGVSWSTVWAAVERVGRPRIEVPGRIGVTEMVGFDETVMQPAHRRRFITAVVDIVTGQVLDVFEGRDAKDLRFWLARRSAEWLAGVQVVSVDPHEGYRSAVLRPDATGVHGPWPGSPSWSIRSMWCASPTWG